ncbi:MAG: ABC transporter permease [Candidatus Aminicenantes bacterium]|nr:ABC transporter permease [Candidatus Aminicenantes bacterium]
MKKLFVIARHEITLRYWDPVVLIFTLAMPLVIAALIYLAFGDVVLGRGVPEAKVPVGIVNQDRGSAWGNFGQLFARAMIPDPAHPALPAELQLRAFAVREIADETRARRLVEREKLFAALLIPPDFSEALAMGRATVEVYIVGRENVLGLAFKSVVETLANMISSGEVTVRTTVEGLLGNPSVRAQLRIGLLDDAMANVARAASSPESNPIQIRRVPPVAQPARIKLAHYLAASIAVMFIGFTALMVSATLFQDKTQGTLQRMSITPTRPEVILGGKILGTYLATLIQLGVLVGGMAALEGILGGNAGDDLQAASPPGIDLLGLTVLILTAAAAATGVGAAIAGLAGTYTQAANYGRAFLVLMGLAGGVFFPVELFPAPLDLLSRVTFQYWAVAGYSKLALGSGATSVLPHSLILASMAILFFAIGSRLLKRRIGFL